MANVRRTIVIPVRKLMPGSREELRLYTMNDDQVALYESVVRALALGGNLPITEADKHLMRTVLMLFRGKVPPAGAPPLFRDLRAAFPILTRKDIEALPRNGCPRGRQTALVFSISVKVGDDQKEIRMVRFDMSPHQREVFYQAIGEISRRDGCSRDDAWEFVHKVVGRLLQGANVVNSPGPLLVRLAEAFAGMGDKRATSLPVATEDDVRKFLFTEEQ